MVIDKLVQIANREEISGQHPTFAALKEAMHEIPECGSGKNRKQACDTLHRIYQDVHNDVYRMCIAPFPEIRSSCGWWKSFGILLAAIAAAAGCTIATAGAGVVACVAAVLGVSQSAITCICEYFDVSWCTS